MIKAEFKKVYNGLERSLLVKKKLVIFRQGREKQPVWLNMASLRPHFSTNKKRKFLVKINEPKLANLFVKRHEMIKILCVPSKLLFKSINEQI